MSIVASSQQVSVTIAAGATTGTATITSVNTATSVCIYGGNLGPETTLNDSTEFGGIALTNATTVTATRGVSDASNSLTVNCTVLEFSTAAVKSVQQGSITMTNATSNTATITSVTTTNSVAVFGGWTSSDANANLTVAGKVALTNATTVTATCGGSGAGISTTVYYAILEFNSGILNSSTQQGTATIAANATSGTATITSVTTGQTFLFQGGWTFPSALSNLTALPLIVLTNGTTVTATNNFAGGAGSITSFNFTAVEFKSADIKSINRGNIVIASGSTSNTATITAVNTGKTASNFLGCYSSTSVSFATNYGTITLTNSTTATAARGASTTDTLTVSYEAIEFTTFNTAWAANSNQTFIGA